TFFCNGGVCKPQGDAGACTEDDDCTSGICGVIGTGRCCAAACSTANPVCGAIDCDAIGACVYPTKSVACGPPQTCVGTLQTNTSACDGKGNCPPSTTDCSPFICGQTACLTRCDKDEDCVPGAFCEFGFEDCCPLKTGDTIRVDGTAGSDGVACCGIGQHQA